MKRAKFVLLCLCLVLFGAAIVIYPERYVECCFDGFVLWAECVLPSLFPFMIIALILIKTGAAEKASLPLRRVTGLFNLPPSAAVCFILSIFSGYPAGSRVVAEFYDGGALTSADCDKLAPLCSTSGPLFIIGSVGYKMFADKTAGIKIFVCHALAVMLFSLVYSLISGKSSKTTLKRAPVGGNVLYDSFYGAVISVAVAGGFIAFFYTFAHFLRDFYVLLPIINAFTPLIGEAAATALAMGLAEATTGCGLIAAVESPLSVPLAGFMITFGGISILMQQLGHLSHTGVKAVKFASFKFLQGVLCFLMLLIIA